MVREDLPRLRLRRLQLGICFCSIFFALRVSPFARRLSLPYFFTRAFSRTCPPSSATTYSSCSEPSPVFSCCVFRRRNSRKFCCVILSLPSPPLSLLIQKRRTVCST